MNLLLYLLSWPSVWDDSSGSVQRKTSSFSLKSSVEHLEIFLRWGGRMLKSLGPWDWKLFLIICTEILTPPHLSCGTATATENSQSKENCIKYKFCINYWFESWNIQMHCKAERAEESPSWKWGNIHRIFRTHELATFLSATFKREVIIYSSALDFQINLMTAQEKKTRKPKKYEILLSLIHNFSSK